MTNIGGDITHRVPRQIIGVHVPRPPVSIGGVNPPDITPWVRIPLSVARPDETPCRIRTQCTMSFFLAKRDYVTFG